VTAGRPAMWSRVAMCGASPTARGVAEAADVMRAPPSASPAGPRRSTSCDTAWRRDLVDQRPDRAERMVLGNAFFGRHIAEDGLGLLGVSSHVGHRSTGRSRKTWKRSPETTVAIIYAGQIVITIFPRARPSSTYRTASGTSLSENRRSIIGVTCPASQRSFSTNRSAWLGFTNTLRSF
jgi:hypothetical protein